MNNHEILICGAGIIGLTIARELVKQGYNNILIIEKEKNIGLHASGRNSGVLHTGIYYPKDSYKAQFCLKGNYLMQDYCRENQLSIKKTGKVLVCQNEKQLETLQTIYSRAIENKTPCELIDEKQLSELEPNAKTLHKALYSEQTCVVDAKQILYCLMKELSVHNKVKILTETRLIKRLEKHCVETTKGKIKFDFFINAAGAHSDRIAHLFDLGLDYQLIPFKGIYKKIKAESSFKLNTCIYPVPDLNNPFLGVHFTKSVDETVYLGPTATPAFSRENYRFLENLDKESFSIVYRDIQLLMLNVNFRQLALSEPKKYFNHYFYQDARKLVNALKEQDIVSSSKIGIRPQLINNKTHQLVMDFMLEQGDNDLHILNAISPAFTSSMAFAEKITGFVH